ncbi:hypothetical protein EN850_02890 [Mesorhizobium sp. M8A.F.Ca.ET.207.01.1.1]|nr:hypothetical protein EN850_02890 [Mesorhizobium sp. M8A.F.Ca.ET.207.01.1.1]
MPLSPCVDQTEKDIETYYRNEPEGSAAAVRTTHGGILTYALTTFDLRRKSGRINVEGFGDFYAKSGKNCYEPTGQKRLVVPTEEVVAWAKEHPRGETGHSTYRQG